MRAGESLARPVPWETVSHGADADEPWREFEAVYSLCFPAVLRYALGRVENRQAAEDLVGDIFERAWRGWHGFRGKSEPRTWVLGIARHVIADHFRRTESRRGGNRVTEIRVDISSGTTTEDIAQRREERRQLLEAVSKLSDADRDVLALRYGADLPFKEVANLLGINETAARMRVQRVLGRLRTVLGEEDRA